MNIHSDLLWPCLHNSDRFSLLERVLYSRTNGKKFLSLNRQSFQSCFLSYRSKHSRQNRWDSGLEIIIRFYRWSLYWGVNRHSLKDCTTTADETPIKKRRSNLGHIFSVIFRNGFHWRVHLKSVHSNKWNVWGDLLTFANRIEKMGTKCKT